MLFDACTASAAAFCTARHATALAACPTELWDARLPHVEQRFEQARSKLWRRGHYRNPLWFVDWLTALEIPEIVQFRRSCAFPLLGCMYST